MPAPTFRAEAGDITALASAVRCDPDAKNSSSSSTSATDISSGETAPAPRPSAPMLQRTWTVTSAAPLRVLHLTVPGVVFVDHAPERSHAAVQAAAATDTERAELPPSAETLPESTPSSNSAATDRLVATISVTSDSRELLEALEVAPLGVDKEDEGVQFTVKSDVKELRGSVLTEATLHDAHELRELCATGTDCVIGDAVLAQNNRAAAVRLLVGNSGTVFLSSSDSMSLRALIVEAMTGAVQLSVPAIDVAEELKLWAFQQGKIMVAADSIQAHKVDALCSYRGETIVQTPSLVAKHLQTWAVFGSRFAVVGAGSATKQSVFIAPTGSVETGGVAAEEVDALTLWRGRAQLHAVDKLEVTSTLFSTVELTSSKPPPSAKISSLRWWAGSRVPGSIVKMAPRADVAQQELLPLPTRAPVAVHYRVSKLGSDIHLAKVKDEAPETWLARATRPTVLVAIAAVGAAAIVLSRRRSA